MVGIGFLKPDMRYVYLFLVIPNLSGLGALDAPVSMPYQKQRTQWTPPRLDVVCLGPQHRQTSLRPRGDDGTFTLTSGKAAAGKPHFQGDTIVMAYYMETCLNPPTLGGLHLFLHTS